MVQNHFFPRRLCFFPRQYISSIFIMFGVGFTCPEIHYNNSLNSVPSDVVYLNKKTVENKKIHTEEQNQIKIFREQNDRILFYYGFCSDFKFQVEIRALDCIFITFFLNKRFMQIVVHFVLKSLFLCI